MNPTMILEHRELADKLEAESKRDEVGQWSVVLIAACRAIRNLADTIDAHPDERDAGVHDVETMVNRFLGWRLPDDFAPDNGISYTPIPRHPDWTHDTHPIGTNLLTAGQAKAMIEHLLAQPSKTQVGEGWVLVPREPTKAMVDAARLFSVAGYCIAPEQWPSVYHAMLAAAPKGVI